MLATRIYASILTIYAVGAKDLGGYACNVELSGKTVARANVKLGRATSGLEPPLEPSNFAACFQETVPDECRGFVYGRQAKQMPAHCDTAMLKLGKDIVYHFANEQAYNL